MPRWPAVVGLVAAVAVLVALGPGVADASGNDPPLADAGLDQTVDNGTTVYLDAGGSVDPDGSVVRVRWTVTAPNGTAVASTCPTCERTAFTPARTGRFTAEVAVTDDDGATRTDALFVTVETAPGPTVALDGPSEVTRDDAATVTANATAGESDLDRIRWFENGSAFGTDDVSGATAAVARDRTFSETGTVELRVTARDAKGYARSATETIRVVAPSSDGDDGNGGGDTGGSGGDGRDCYYWTSTKCSTEDFLRDRPSGDGMVVVDTNNDGVLEAPDGTWFRDPDGDGVADVNDGNEVNIPSYRP